MQLGTDHSNQERPVRLTERKENKFPVAEISRSVSITFKHLLIKTKQT